MINAEDMFRCSSGCEIMLMIKARTRGVFNNASARSAPRCLQALAIQVDRCIAWKSKMATKTINGFS